MATVTSPILTDATFATKMDALAAAVKPDASDIPLTPPSGMTATNVQDGFSEIKQSLSDYFSKEFEATASTERDFILSVMTQAYSYLTSHSLSFIFCNVSWTNNNSGYAILSANRRFQIQIGDSVSLGVLNSAGTALANLRSVTTTAHP